MVLVWSVDGLVIVIEEVGSFGIEEWVCWGYIGVRFFLVVFVFLVKLK